jgi:mRNA-degrading endonuclease toxin of MazEF toxin-antitoxin module
LSGSCNELQSNYYFGEYGTKRNLGQTGQAGAPFRPTLTFQGKSGRILLDQIRTVDKARLVKKLGVLSTQTHQKALLSLQELFAS